MPNGTVLIFLAINNIVLLTILLSIFRLHGSNHNWNEPREMPTTHAKSSCLNLSRDDGWQEVGHPQHKYWVYSAYSFDDTQVVIIGSPPPFTADEYNQPLVQCLFYFADESKQSTDCFDSDAYFVTKAEMNKMERYDPNWAATFVRCPLPDYEEYQSKPPTFVSVLLENQTYSSAHLRIQYRNLSESYQRTFSACVLPLYDYDDMFHFLEWLEFYRVMGVEQFTFYNKSIGPHTSCVLNHAEKYYADEITVNVHPWQGYRKINGSKIKFRTDRTELSAGSNECMYRHKGVSKYMIFADVDEFITPSEGITDYYHLLEILGASHSPEIGANKVGAYIFQNTFHLKSRKVDVDLKKRCSIFEENRNEFDVCQNMWTMQFSEADPAMPWGMRSKFIAVPDVVENAGIHTILKYINNDWVNMNVDTQFASSRHYRYFNSSEDTTVARMPLAMETHLVVNLAASVEYFMTVCELTFEDVFG